MILTVTMNPSVDISYYLERFEINAVNRTKEVSKTAGGKGLNVSRVLRELGASVVATGVVGGHLGEYIEESLEKAGIKSCFHKIAGESRNCIVIIHEGMQSEILEAGPELTEKDGAFFIEKFKTLTDKASIITVSGSLPRGLQDDFYNRLLDLASDKRVILDVSGSALKNALTAKNPPFLIKPNLEEAQSLLKRDISIEASDLKAALNEGLFARAEWVLLSLGKEGAAARCKDAFYRLRVPEITAVNPVGSGDATVAGAAYSLEKGLTDTEVLKCAMASGVLNALESKTGHINFSRFEEFRSRIIVEPL